VPINKTAAYM
jgi:D-alanyl-D-alanine carboxypeptidase